MTAAELIEKLSELPPDQEIKAPYVGCCGDGGWDEAILVRLGEEVALVSKEDFDA